MEVDRDLDAIRHTRAYRRVLARVRRGPGVRGNYSMITVPDGLDLGPFDEEEPAAETKR